MNSISIKLKSIKDNIGISRNIIGIVALTHNPTMSFLNELKTIVSEAITNCIIHGYGGSGDFDIYLDIKTNEEGIEIVITDFGIGIEDVELARTPMFSTKKSDDRSGLGFTIMEIFSDEIEIESKLGKGTKIKILKKWN